MNLARKYRPQNLDALVGQDFLITTIKQSFIDQRIPQAILLHGIRGVGKTTTARIIAKSLNCQQGPTINPCNKCESCLAVQQDKHLDVLEIDAASRTGVDDIREIIDSIPYKAVQGKFKIFIIDEVHMLSKSAFNALLKTLEEPPAHVKFIFATTELRKIPETILSRCMRFDLNRIISEQIFQQIEKIAHLENFTIELDAISYLAKAADGSMRDALSLLDQAIVSSNNKNITTELVKNMLGLCDRNQLFNLLHAIFLGQPEQILQQTQSIFHNGGDALLLLQDLLELTYWLICLKTTPNLAKNQIFPEIDRQAGEKIITDLQPSVLMQTWQILLKGYAEIQNAPMPFHALEMLLLRIAFMSKLSPLEDLLVESGGSGPNHTQSSVNNGSTNAVANKLEVTHDQYSQTPNNFSALLELLKNKKEMLLYAQVATYVHLVDFKIGQITVRLKTGHDGQLIKKLTNFLVQVTNINWQITLSNKLGDLTFDEQEESRKTSLLRQAINHPYVINLAKVFPDWELHST